MARKLSRNPLTTLALMAVCLAAVLTYLIKSRPADFEPSALAPAPDAAAAPEPEPFKRSRDVFGAPVTITVLAGDTAQAEALVEVGFAEMTRLDALLGSRGEQSEVARLNSAAGGEPVAIGPDLQAVLEEAKLAAQLSGGAFDPTWAALAPLWEPGSDAPRRPTAEAAAVAVARVDYRKLQLDPEAGTARLAEAGMVVDLGGVAKGYAVDRAVLAMRASGGAQLLVEAGGDRFAAGRQGSRPWSIGVRDPRNPDAQLGTIPVEDRAVTTVADRAASSPGDSGRPATEDGARHHHILDPRTGMPAQACRSATVLASTAMQADALATALFVLGPEQAIKLANRLDGVETLIVDAEGRTLMTPGMAKVFRRTTPQGR